jgi:hypothetical protein
MINLNFKIASEYKKKLFLQSIGLQNDDKQIETKIYIKDIFNN